MEAAFIQSLQDLVEAVYTESAGFGGYSSYSTSSQRVEHSTKCILHANQHYIYIYIYIYTNKTGDCLFICLSVRLWAAKPQGVTG